MYRFDLSENTGGTQQSLAHSLRKTTFLRPMASLSKFPLLKLPLLAFQSVLLNFQFSDLIHFSFSSKRIKYLIKLMKIKFGEFDVHLREKNVHFSLRTTKTFIEAKWFFNSPEFVERSENMAAKIHINHLRLKSLTVDQDFYTYDRDVDRDVAHSAKKVFKYLNKLFSCPLPTVFISTEYILKREWKKTKFFFGLKQCTELVVEGHDKIRGKYLRTILEELVITKQLSLNLPVRKSFKFNIATIKHPEEIWIAHCAHWVTSEMIFPLNISRLILNQMKWTAKDFETFVERWVNSDDTFFRFSQFLWNRRVPADLNFENLGVELREFDPEARGPAYRYSVNQAYDLSTGRDIIRKDGLMATVAVSEHFFVFCVWHERHHNMDGVQKTLRLR
ncbi:unnamed protein product [Caenorhabditis brenneri]